ncbi:sensor histidine kinase [Paenibacillus donghaensis]|nr:HAMP domain-containing sensor histidine kinase [Paenibacillus donghaensis]
MNRFSIFTNMDVRRLFGVLAAVPLVLLLAGLLNSQIALHGLETKLIERDYRIAGYLLEHGIRETEVAAAYSGEASAAQSFTGRKFLSGQGYTSETGREVLPEADQLRTRLLLGNILWAVLGACLILLPFLFYFKRQQNTLEDAQTVVVAFMRGNTASRLDCEKEGSLYQFFTAVNELATSLHAHVQAEQERKAFLKNTLEDISHQLKTPLAALSMYNEIILEDANNPDVVRKFSLQTTASLQRMERLIDNLLRITKLDAGTVKMDKQPYQLQQLLQETMLQYEASAQQERKTITLQGPEATILYCDAAWMAEAAGNLLKNALEHTAAGGRIHVCWRETPALVTIRFQDDGKGIHPQDLHHIFKRFYRSRFAQEIDGTGLGLPVTKSIVEAFGGSLSVESEPGSGCVFTMNFVKLTRL